MATTPFFGFRYPVLGDAPNVPLDLENLATDVETQINKTRYARLAADQNKISSTTLADLPGLSFTLAANAEYLLDGMISMYGVDAADVKFAWTGPTGMTVSWGFRGMAAANVDGSNTGISVASLEAYTDANIFAVGTEVDFATMCTPLGYWKTAATAGTLQLRWAQFVSNAATTSIKRGSWLRLHRIV